MVRYGKVNLFYPLSGATWCFFWSCRRTTLSPLKCDATCTVGGETSKCSDTRRLMGWKPRSRTIIDWRIWFQHVSTITTYPLVICYIAIENGYLYWIYPLKMVIQWFSIVMLVYQRVIRLNPLIDSNNNDYVPLPEGSRLISKSQYMSMCGVSIM